MFTRVCSRDIVSDEILIQGKPNCLGSLLRLGVPRMLSVFV